MRRLTPLDQAALEDLREKLKEYNDDDYETNFYQSIKHLVERGFITAVRKENNEFGWQVTELGQEFVEKHGELINESINTTVH